MSDIATTFKLNMSPGDDAAGGDASFESVLKQSDGALRAFLRRQLSKAHPLEDAVQETYLRMMRYRGMSDPEQLRALLFTVATSVIKDRYRRASTHLAGEYEALEDTPLESPAPPMERVLIGREELARVKDAIRALPPRCREVFLLHRFEGLSYKDIAQRLGTSPRTVENQVAHALAICRKAIGEKSS